jgi:hypothetical protein
MTTLKEGREMLLAMCTPDNCPDIEFCRKQRCQVNAITTGANVYYWWINAVAFEDRLRYGTAENHPEAMEGCLNWWHDSEGDRIWGEEYQRIREGESVA